MSEDHSRQQARKLEEVFMHIANTRMADIPIVNPALQVQALGDYQTNDHLMYLLITPWFMNLIVLPRSDGQDFYNSSRIGDSVRIALPGGIFPCLLSVEAGIGRYLSCSFFSPMAEFRDQEQAVATATAIMSEIFASPSAEETQNAEAEEWAQILSPGIGGDKLPEKAPEASQDNPNKPENLATKDAMIPSRRKLLGLKADQSRVSQKP